MTNLIKYQCGGSVSGGNIGNYTRIRIQHVLELIRIQQNSIVDPDPHGSGTFAWIRNQQNMKDQINKNVISL